MAPGAADRSYGIQVAKLAGLPGEVVSRAAEVLEIIENGEQSGAVARLADDLPLFSAQAPAPAANPGRSALAAAMAELRPDELSPRQALELIYKLKALADEGGEG